jgi:hypothetical protein
MWNYLDARLHKYTGPHRRIANFLHWLVHELAYLTS